MPQAALLLHGIDPLFPNGERQALGPPWAKRRFVRLVWPGLWKALLAVVFCTTGCVLVSRVDWPQTGILIVPGAFLIVLGVWNAFLAFGKLCAAASGYAMLAFLDSKPLRAFFQNWAAESGAGFQDGTKCLEHIHPYGLTRREHADACAHLRLFQTNAVLVVKIHTEQMQQGVGFPQVFDKAYGHLFVDPEIINRPVLWAHFPKIPFELPVDAHPSRFALLRWLAAKAAVRSVYIGLPLTGNPQGSAHERMAFWASLAGPLQSPT